MANYTVEWEEKNAGASKAINYSRVRTTVSASSAAEAKSKALGSKRTNPHISVKGVNAYKK